MHEYHFGYKGSGRMFTFLKAQFGSNSILNVAWTAPLLIGLGLHVQ